MTDYAVAHMPPPAPLVRPLQTFSQVQTARKLQKERRLSNNLWRISAFIPTIVLTLALCLSLNRYLAQDGVMLVEGAVLALVGLTFVWLAFSVNTACLGLIRIALDPPSDPGQFVLGPQTGAPGCGLPPGSAFVYVFDGIEG